MNKALDDSVSHEKTYGRDWRKSMSDNVAYALVAYTALHIFATVSAMKETGMQSMALFALVVLVAAIIPACRKFESRWKHLSDAEAADPSYASSFRRDQIVLWILALGLPFALTALFKGIAAAG